MIREAEIRDRARIEELYRILIPDADDINVLEERIEQIKRDSNNFLYVAEIDGRVEGTVLLSICLDAMFGNRPYAVAENIIVDPASRGKGVGKDLITCAVSQCKKLGCREVLLMSNLRRTEAHLFFERQGFSPVAKGFKKYLD
ncbi:GNAT family N-acetyltransferase [Paenibacillus oenotherae]|uniref:GNAT family N-acetyltransferase n=1 Tax=Paenibacillus oenotherae TaxID=1435645 RepID=A0ABS7CZU5_9BACL|nr:GNAT family N-acetyltransferase [Paenibacillus oenotherae]MBW7473140.1 GNAT family N-acetyltransferase [Paenibacillus oenotherae]